MRMQVLHPETRRTHLVLLDAHTMTTVATIRLQHFVPNGFHGTMVRRTFVRPPRGVLASVGSDDDDDANVDEAEVYEGGESGSTLLATAAARGPQAVRRSRL